MSAFRFRPARRADLGRIKAIHLANWRIGHRGIMPDSFLGEPLAADMERRWSRLPGDGNLLIVAEGRRGLEGFALVRFDHPDGPLVESLHVDRKRQGGGLGRALLRHVARAVRDLGYDEIWLEVLRDNSGARRFYRRNGGVEGEVFRDVLAGHEVAAVPVRWASLDELAGPFEDSGPD